MSQQTHEGYGADRSLHAAVCKLATSKMASTMGRRYQQPETYLNNNSLRVSFGLYFGDLNGYFGGAGKNGHLEVRVLTYEI